MSLSLAFISTYPPTQCGIATFTRSMLTHIVRAGATASVIRVVGEKSPTIDLRGLPTEVRHEWHSTEGAPAAAAVVNEHDVAVLEHEFGIFPGPDGLGVLALVDEITVPLISVLHTVVAEPTDRQKMIIEWIGQRSGLVVTMSKAARTRLLHHYDVDASRVVVVPHGALGATLGSHGRTDRPRVLTWGLLGPGKGLEWAVAAMAQLGDMDPRPVYEVVGQTHPKVLQREGTAYQDGLQSLAHSLGLDEHVRFDHRYLATDALRRVVSDSDIVVLPYDSTDQVTSGVLIEAVVAGRPVIATRFPHAEELLATGAGITVPHRDPDAIADAVRQILTEPGLARRMAGEAARLAPSLRWSSVAERFLFHANEVATTTVRAAS